jgi:hypothetical protein
MRPRRFFDVPGAEPNFVIRKSAHSREVVSSASCYPVAFVYTEEEVSEAESGRKPTFLLVPDAGIYAELRDEE